MVPQSGRAAEDAAPVTGVICGWMRCPPMVMCLYNIPGFIEVVCMAHARRYFKEALPTG